MHSTYNILIITQLNTIHTQTYISHNILNNLKIIINKHDIHYYVKSLIKKFLLPYTQ